MFTSHEYTNFLEYYRLINMHLHPENNYETQGRVREKSMIGQVTQRKVFAICLSLELIQNLVAKPSNFLEH